LNDVEDILDVIKTANKFTNTTYDTLILAISWRTLHTYTCFLKTHTHTYTIVLQLFWTLSRTTRVSRYQKGKTNLDLLEQETVSGSVLGHMKISTSQQITTPTSHHSVFYKPDALPAAQPTASMKTYIWYNFNFNN